MKPPDRRSNVKRLAISAVLITATAQAFPADAGVSASVGEHNFYGRLDIGGYPTPRLIYQQSVAVKRVSLSRQPIYLHVVPGHEKNWREHCYAYSACGERVYFVQHGWFNREFVPRFLERHRERRNDRREGRNGNGKATIKTMITAAGEVV